MLEVDVEPSAAASLLAALPAALPVAAAGAALLPAAIASADSLLVAPEAANPLPAAAVPETADSGNAGLTLLANVVVSVLILDISDAANVADTDSETPGAAKISTFAQALN
jgi:hypothetical protein